jgi:hypothetical protein
MLDKKTQTPSSKMDANSKKPAENKKALISLIKDTLLRVVVA